MVSGKARIGLALSGGGIRAAVFHLGVLQYLAEAKFFDQIASISSVSGASLCIGAGNKWPSGDAFIRDVQPKVREMILDNNIQKSALLRLPVSPKYWRDKVKLIAKMLEDKWGVNGTLQDLPRYPYWEINCTTFETGKSFRLRRDYMGDHKIGYVQNPELPISHMIAASAGFPVLIGPYILKTKGLRWTKDKRGLEGEVQVGTKYTLWDGGVYDNLGLEALYKIGRGLDSEIDYLMVSNASASIRYQKRKRDLSLTNMKRLLDIATSQVDSLRSRDVIASVISKGDGMYIKIGNSAGFIAQGFGVPQEKAAPIAEDCLSAEDAAKVRDYATTLNTPSREHFELIFRHGYENAKCVHLFGGMADSVVLRPSAGCHAR
jgi:NTE family protein